MTLDVGGRGGLRVLGELAAGAELLTLVPPVAGAEAWNGDL